MIRDEVITLKSGIRISTLILGSLEPEKYLFYFHGLPGSRIEVLAARRYARKLKIQIIALDRPGFGNSVSLPGREIIDWPEIVGEVADYYGLQKFSVFGVSGGAPYALACGRFLSERVKKVLVVSGIGPLSMKGAMEGMVLQNRVLLEIGKYLPGITDFVVNLAARWWQKKPEHLLWLLKLILSKDDQRLLGNPVGVSFLLRNIKEALKQGSVGACQDFRVLCRDWGFKLEDVPGKVFLWHGEADNYVPVAMGRKMVERIPNCQAEYLPGKGHFMVIEMLEEVFEVL